MRIVIGVSAPFYEWLPGHIESETGAEVTVIRNRDDLTKEALDELSPDYVFLPHWSFIVPEEVWSNFEVVVFHMTDLPYGRGGTPLQNLIVRGHKETQLSALRCESGVDTGPVYLKRPLNLEGTAQEIYERAAEVIAGMIEDMIQTRPAPLAQDGPVVEFRRRGKDDSRLDDVSSAPELYDRIRMVDAEGYPHAFVEVGRMRISFTDAMIDGSAVVAHARIEVRDD